MSLCGFADGIRISSSDSIESLLMDDFDLIINDVCYRVVVPSGQKLTLVGSNSLMLLSSTRVRIKLTMGIALMTTPISFGEAIKSNMRLIMLMRLYMTQGKLCCSLKT